MRFFIALSMLSLVAAGDAVAKPVLYVLNKAEATASALDPASGEILATIPVGDGPHEAAASPDGRRIVVCNYGQQAPGSTLTVIDTADHSVVRTIELGAYHRPHGIQFLPDGERVVVTAEAERMLLVVNVSTGAVEQAIGTEQDISHMVTMGPAGTRAFVPNIRSGSVSVIDLPEGELVKIVETGAGAEGAATDMERGEIWVTNRSADTVSIIDSETLEIVATLECAAFPIRAAITPDSKHALISCARSGDVAVFDCESRELVKRIAMATEAVEQEKRRGRLFENAFGDSPVPIGILIEPSGKRAYVANTNADIVTVINLETWEIERRLTAGKEPDGLAWVNREV